MPGVAALLLAVALSTTAAAASEPLPRWETPRFAGWIASSAIAHELQTFDINGDGRRDALVGLLEFDRIQTTPPVVLLNRGGGRFVDATAALFDGPPPAMEWNRHQVVADYNGDGRPDVFFADVGTDNLVINPGWPGQTNKLALSTPAGKLRDASLNLPQTRSFTHSAAAGDVDGDGDIDLFENNAECCGEDRVPPRVLLNDGSGRFTPSSGELNGVPRDRWGNAHSYACVLADVTGDGALDLVLGASEHVWPSVVLRNDRRGNFALHTRLPPTLYPAGNGFAIDMVAVDVDGDGDLDLLIAETLNEPYYIGTRIQVLVNDGQGDFKDETARRLPEQPSGRSWPGRLLVEDVNDDGRPDLAVQYAPIGIVLKADPTPLWLNRNGVFVATEPPRQGPPAEQRGPVAFVDGAGPHALLSLEWRNETWRNRPGLAFYVTPQLVPPRRPTSIRAVRVQQGVKISWRPVAGARRYEVWRHRPRVRLGTTAVTSYVDRRARGRLAYVVRAMNGAGQGPFSAPARP